MPDIENYPSELAKAIGYVVLEASDAEDSIGELVVLRTGLEEPDPRWWRSGEALVRALDGLGDSTLQSIAVEYRSMLPLRHHVVHGLWLRPPGEPDVFMTMLRGKPAKNRPSNGGYETRVWTADSLVDLARRFHALDQLADDAISDAMGLNRREGSLLPLRTEPVQLPSRKGVTS